MKTRFFQALALLAIAAALLVGGGDVRQSPPDPTCHPFICDE